MLCYYDLFHEPIWMRRNKDFNRRLAASTLLWPDNNKRNTKNKMARALRRNNAKAEITACMSLIGLFVREDNLEEKHPGLRHYYVAGGMAAVL